MDFSVLFITWMLFSIPWLVAFMRGVKLGLVPSTRARCYMLWLGYMLDALTLSPGIQPKHPSLLFVPIFSALFVYFVGRAIVIPFPAGTQASSTASDSKNEETEPRDESLEGRIGAEYVGTYRGRLHQGSSSSVPIETVIKLKPSGKLAGSYVYKDPQDHDAPGTLIQTGQIKDRTVRFQWTDDAGTGSLVIMFDEDYNHFDGEWSPNGQSAIEVLRARGSFDGLTWSGDRNN